MTGLPKLIIETTSVNNVLAVRRVVNMYGPQTRLLDLENKGTDHGANVEQEPCVTASVEERLSSMEEHLRMKGMSINIHSLETVPSAYRVVTFKINNQLPYNSNQ